MYGYIKESWMTFFLFKDFMYFFKRTIPRRISQTNRHLLIIYEFCSHVTLKAIHKA